LPSAEDPGLVAGLVIGDAGLPAARLAVAQVHAQEHVGPVARLGASRPGVDAHESAALIVGAREHAGQLHRPDALLDPGDLLLELPLHLLVLLVLGQFEQLSSVLDSLFGLGIGLYGVDEIGAFFLDLRGRLGLVPEAGFLHVAVDGRDALPLPVDVKEAPLAHRTSFPGPPDAL
jgi:hypothetical protein